VEGFVAGVALVVVAPGGETDPPAEFEGALDEAVRGFLVVPFFRVGTLDGEGIAVAESAFGTPPGGVNLDEPFPFGVVILPVAVIAEDS
jgi:hypothetical protein